MRAARGDVRRQRYLQRVQHAQRGAGRRRHKQLLSRHKAPLEGHHAQGAGSPGAAEVEQVCALRVGGVEGALLTDLQALQAVLGEGVQRA